MIDWNQVETVLLDMDGTLLDLHFDNYFWLEHVPRVFSTTFDIPHAEAVSKLYQLFDQKKGSMEWYCLDYWSRELQLDIVQLKHDVHEKIAIRPFVTEFLQGLQRSSRNVILVTNAHRGSLDLKMQKTGLKPFFHATVSTHDYGMPKEQPEFWSKLAKDYYFLPSATLLVDDTEPVLSSAENHGIQHLITIKQPDSRGVIRTDLSYPSILHFDEIMPDGNNRF